MSVVLRCPHCGTTKATTGDCEACHDAQVRYFCTNHTPGLWLEANSCLSCGARFGEPARKTSGSAPASGPRKRLAADPSRKRPRAPARASTPPPAEYASVEPRELDERVRSSRRPPAYEDARSPGASGMALLQHLFRAALRTRYMPSRASRDHYAPRIRRGAGGCVKSLLLSGLLLLLALGSAIFVFGRALIGL